MSEIQQCTVDDISADLGACPCAARWIWHPDEADHPVFLCNFHAEPFTADAVVPWRPWPYDGAEGRARLTGNVG